VPATSVAVELVAVLVAVLVADVDEDVDGDVSVAALLPGLDVAASLVRFTSAGIEMPEVPDDEGVLADRFSGDDTPPAPPTPAAPLEPSTPVEPPDTPDAPETPELLLASDPSSDDKLFGN